ncbi:MULTISPECIES: 2OG-Fe(II) oxygenase [unclassified Mesorhizobium]|uniref:2OG-Fe(II) oxygenase n=1 Tax=unclassified Mesorhizobium TaxID=325217 RepID=UPI0006FEA43F|nr:MULTISPECIES: 2OG-Fe(II) oxygenase [unclassified Mesorhizobium]KQZ15151.1 hypothetical protein ASD27_14645 [Mesorhizobium sp. Root1471]KQZ37659.1 hypothetical protein ASD44_14640 [Mesorhizobium sp. Root554]MDR7033706.1 hypothetical protein [Mesorhizobium sp. BE184]
MTSAKIAKELTPDSIRKLVAKEIDVIHVPGFYPRDISLKFAEKIAANSKLEAYKTQTALKRLGMGYVDVGQDAGNAIRYHDEAIQAVWDIRNLMYPYITPLDHLRLMLEEIWPAGSNIESIDEHKCFVGTCRVIDPGAKMLPHSDRLGRMLINGESDLTGQLAVNIYLKMPQEGGEIELWLREPTPDQDKEMVISDGLDRTVLGEPPLLIRPEQGDLVIFNSQLIHGVTPGKGSDRVTMSSFIGYRGDEAPLTYWS